MSDNSKAFVDKKIKAALIAHAYSQSTTGLITSLFCASVILFGLYNVENNLTLINWYIFLFSSL